MTTCRDCPVRQSKHVCTPVSILWIPRADTKEPAVAAFQGFGPSTSSAYRAIHSSRSKPEAPDDCLSLRPVCPFSANASNNSKGTLVTAPPEYGRVDAITDNEHSSYADERALPARQGNLSNL